MKARLAGLLLFAGGLAAFATSTRAQIIEFRATINAAQETATVVSGANGTAVLLYDVSANTFDLFVTLNNVTNNITGSHIHDGVAGVAGPVVTNFGGEAVYVRTGNTLTGTFRNVTHGGNKLALLTNGAYLNYHSAAYPGGEIRGQLIAQPKRLSAVIDAVQEIATPAIVSNAFGAALMSYNSGTNRMILQVTLYNFSNTLTASHYHEAAPGVNGPVVTNLGGAAAYTVSNGFIRQVFDIPYTGDPIKLLTGGTYLNFHSNVYGGGEIRGQVRALDEVPSSRLINASTRGFAGTGNQVLISGLAITGPEPVGVRIIARGPSLANYGVIGTLADPTMSLYTLSSALMATNDNHTLTAPGPIPTLLDSKESVLDLILPPGAYSVVVSGVGGGTGIALIETFEQRRGPLNNIGVASLAPFKHEPSASSSTSRVASVRPLPEMCVSPAPTAVSETTATAAR